jgi:hypothetical protein
MLEKVWAKVNGNYQFANGGVPNEVYELFLGAPSMSSAINGASGYGGNYTAIFNDAMSAFNRGFVMGLATNHTIAAYNLPTGHAYSLLGTYVVTEKATGKTHNLFRVRNPWGTTEIVNFSGSWAYNSTNWGLVTIPSTLPYTNTLADGVYWLEDFELQQAYD